MTGRFGVNIDSYRHANAEGASPANSFRLDPDPSAMNLDDPFHQRQTYAGSITFGIDFVKQAEDFFLVKRFYADSVIADKKYVLFVLLPCAYLA